VYVVTSAAKEYFKTVLPPFQPNHQLEGVEEMGAKDGIRAGIKARMVEIHEQMMRWPQVPFTSGQTYIRASPGSGALQVVCHARMVGPSKMYSQKSNSPRGAFLLLNWGHCNRWKTSDHCCICMVTRDCISVVYCTV
jgi:hypothetical protein